MNGYNIIKVTLDRLDEVLSIYAAAREFMCRTGNPNQWKTFRPEKATLEKDIEIGQLYAIERDGELFASFFVLRTFIIQSNAFFAETLVSGEWAWA